MSARTEIPSGERDKVRVFAVDLSEGEAADFAKRAKSDGRIEQPLLDALGAKALDPRFVDVIRLTDLKPAALSEYLVEGIGVAKLGLRKDRDMLDDLEGVVVIVLSQAFPAKPVTLTPAPPLRLLGTYTEDRPGVRFEPLPAEGAKSTGGPEPEPEPTSASPQPASRRSGSLTVLMVLAAIAVIAGMLIWGVS